jgi:hypothetical protein
MKIKFTLLTLFAAILFNFSYGQVSIGRSSIGPFKDFKKGEYDLIKGKTTVFVVDEFDLKEFDAMLKPVWKVNKYVIVSREDFQKSSSKYITEEYAIWEMNGRVVTSTSSKGMTTEYLYIYLEYYYPTDIKEKKKKTVFDRNQIAAVFFGGNTEAMWEMIRTEKFGDFQEDLYNYRLGYLKNYFQYVNDNLISEGFSFAYDTDYDKKKIKALAKATLYVPDYFKVRSKLGWSDEDRENPDELFKKYTYKYEFISDEDLDKKILNATEDFYYIMYTRVNGQKFVSVVNGKTGDIIYKDYQTFSYQVKPKDIGELNSKIKK